MSTQTSGQGTTGVIHNIGYRHYAGARLGRFDIAKALFSQTLRGSFGIGRGLKAKIFPWFLVACTVLPAFIIVAVEAGTAQPEVIVDFHQYTVIVQIIPVLFVAVQAPQAMSRDLRFKTLPLYFSRPLPARGYVAAKFAGVWTGLMLLLIVPLLLLYVGALLIEAPFGSSTLHFVQAVVADAFLALLLTGIALLIASVTPRRGLGVAAIVTALAGSYGAATMMQGILSFSDSANAVWGGLLSPVSIYDMAQTGIFHLGTSNGLGIPTRTEGLIFLAVLLGFAALSYWLLNLRYRKLATA